VALGLAVGFVEEAFYGGIFDGPVHAFDLAVGPWVPGFGQTMIDIVEGAGILECMCPERFFACDELFDFGGAPGFAARIGEVDTVIGEHGVDLIRHGGDQGAQEVSGGACGGLLMQLDEGKLAGPVYGHEEVEFAIVVPPLDYVASRCGFANAEMMRRVFLRRTGTRPSHYRERLRGSYQPETRRPV
jgi:AraC-like DNA-binding protein